MTTDSKTTAPVREVPRWFKIAQAVFIGALTVALYFVGLSMVQSRFHQGGHLDRHGHISR
jgi:hypothetical protein